MLRTAGIAVATLLSPLAAQPRTWIVDAQGGGDFTDLPPALAAASDGDTIRIRAGAYDGGTTSKALTLLGDAGAGIRLPGSGPALRITALPADRTFALAGVAAIAPATIVFPTVFVQIDACDGRVHLERVQASLIAPPYSAQTSHLPLSIQQSRHVTVQGCTLEGATGMRTVASTVVVGGSTVRGQSAQDDPRSGRRSAGGAIESSGGALVLSEVRLTGGDGTAKWLVGGYWPSAAGLVAQDTGITLAGSAQSLVAAGSAVPLPMPAIDGSGGKLQRDPRVMLAPNASAPPVAATIPDAVQRLPRMIATGARPGGILKLELLATNGDLAEIYLSLPAYPIALPPLGELWLDVSTLIVLGRFQVPASETVPLSLPVPPLPSLTGLPVTMQALAGSAAGIRLSTPATVLLDG